MKTQSSRHPSTGPGREVIVSVLLLVLSAAFPRLGQAQSTNGEPPPVGFLGWSLWLLGFVIVWGAAYWGLYPYLLRYYPPKYSENIFWPLVIIGLTAWLHLGPLLFLGGHFYLIGGWISACVAGSIALLWLLFALLHRA